MGQVVGRFGWPPRATLSCQTGDGECHPLQHSHWWTQDCMRRGRSGHYEVVWRQVISVLEWIPRLAMIHGLSPLVRSFIAREQEPEWSHIPCSSNLQLVLTQAGSGGPHPSGCNNWGPQSHLHHQESVIEFSTSYVHTDLWTKLL